MSLHYFTMVRVLLHIGPNELHCEGGEGGNSIMHFLQMQQASEPPHTPLICETYFHFRFSFFVLFSDLMLSFQNCTVKYFDLVLKKFELNTSSNKNVTFSKKEFKMSTTFIEVFYNSIFSIENEKKMHNIHRFIKKKNIYRVMDIICSSYQWLHVSMLNQGLLN